MKNEPLCPMDELVTIDLAGYCQEDPSAETTYYDLTGEEAAHGQAE